MSNNSQSQVLQMLPGEIINQSWLAQGESHAISAHPMTGLVAAAASTSLV